MNARRASAEPGQCGLMRFRPTGFLNFGSRLSLTRVRSASISIVNMPTYEYICEKCGLEFEKFQAISAKALRVCPEDICKQKRWGKGKVKRAISAGAGVIFKGSGFYITDYRSEKYKEAAKKEAAPAASSTSEAKSSSAADAKPATSKAETKPSKAPPAK